MYSFLGINMEEQKQQIIETAFQLFKQYGIKSVSVDDICHQIGMSKKTFYVYFKQKDELVTEVLNYMHDQHREQSMKALKGKSTLECVRLLIQLPSKLGNVHHEPPFAYDLQKYYPNIYHDHITHVRRATREFITCHLKQGIEEGVYRKDLDVEMCSIFFVMMQQAYIQNINKVHNVSPKRIGTCSFDLFLRTVLSEAGKKQMTALGL